MIPPNLGSLTWPLASRSAPGLLRQAMLGTSALTGIMRTWGPTLRLIPGDFVERPTHGSTTVALA